MPVKDFVSQIYFDGLPLDQATTYSEEDAEILIEMLNDPSQVKYHENIALTLGMIGSARAVDPMISFIREGTKKPEVEISRRQYKGYVGATVALGYLVNLSKSEKALSFLVQSTSPDTWKKSGIKGLAASAEARRDLSKYAIIGLGLSGNDEAAAYLKSLRDSSQKRTTDEASFLMEVDDVVSQSLQMNEQISRDGLLKYYKGDAE